MQKHLTSLSKLFAQTSIVIILSAGFAASRAPAATLDWAGDIRFRSVQLREGSNDSRLYQQIRARLGFQAKVQEDLTAVIRLATATSAISNNQTLGDSKEPGMQRRPFGLDLAYGEWAFAPEAKLNLGRTINPFFAPGKTQLVFDHDLAFEGLAISYRPRVGDDTVFVNLGTFIISENYAAPSDVVDTGLIGIDAGYVFKTEDVGQFTVHVARFHYLNVAGQPITALDASAKIDSSSTPSERVRGNSVYADNPLAPSASRKYFYQKEFVQTEAGLEWKLKHEAVEYTAYADTIANDHAGDLSLASEVGVSAKYGHAQFVVAFAEKKSDSVLGTFSDSDFNGGGTDNRGVKLGISYQLGEASYVALTDYHATRGIDSTSRPYNAQQLDFSLQF